METGLLHHLHDVSDLIAEWTVVLIGLVSILVVIMGSIEAAFRAVSAMLRRGGEPRMRQVWIRYARWLVAALTFQLAADLVETTVAPTTEDLLRLAATAAIRTFLNYFLDRDIEAVRHRAAEGTKT